MAGRNIGTNMTLFEISAVDSHFELIATVCRYFRKVTDVLGGWWCQWYGYLVLLEAVGVLVRVD